MNQKRKRKKSVQNVGVAPRRALLAKIIVHIIIIIIIQERERDRQTKQKKTRKTAYLSAGFATKAPLGRSFSFLLSFRARFLISGLLFVTRKQRRDPTHNTRPTSY